MSEININMHKLFESNEINGMVLANRFVRSATWDGLSDEHGNCTPKMVKLMTLLAKGGVGLIITGHAYVQIDGKSQPNQLGIDRNEVIDGLIEMTRSIHKHSGKVALQISHGGILANQNLTGQPILVPSKVKGFNPISSDEMNITDIRRVVKSFGKAAVRAKDAGFDAIQIHAAHAVLLSEFLSPSFNKRNDEYGGSIENRTRIIIEVLQEVRTAVGEKYPILVKMNCQDFLEGGLSLEDSLKVAEILEQNFVDAIELSGGTRFSGEFSHWRKEIISEEREAYFRDAAKLFKEKLHVPIILVGGIRTFSLAVKLVDECYADYISMSRPFICEPDLVKRWAFGDHRRAKCVSDNRCYDAAMAGEGIYCITKKKYPDMSSDKCHDIADPEMSGHR